MKAKIPITIAIPTHKAGLHLLPVFESIYKQSKFNTVKQILLIVDGNILATTTKNAIKSSKLKIINHSTRLGQSARLNEIFRLTQTDLLVLLNDDVIIARNAMSEVIKKYTSSDAHLLTVSVAPLPSSHFLQRVLRVGTLIKNIGLSKDIQGSGYLASNGRFLVLDKKLYKKIKVPNQIWNNDAYIFLFTKLHEFNHAHITKILCFYEDPNNVHEYLRQTLKYQFSLEENSHHFTKTEISPFYHVSRGLLLQAYLKVASIYPIYTASYLGLYLYTRLQKYRNRRFEPGKNYWQTDQSTKAMSSGWKL